MTVVPSTAPASASGVRTGVDTTLVAPVNIGDGAHTGAGSVITEDVPPGALGIARARQKNIEGYSGRDDGKPSSRPAMCAQPIGVGR